MAISGGDTLCLWRTSIGAVPRGGQTGPEHTGDKGDFLPEQGQVHTAQLGKVRESKEQVQSPVRSSGGRMWEQHECAKGQSLSWRRGGTREARAGDRNKVNALRRVSDMQDGQQKRAKGAGR